MGKGTIIAAAVAAVVGAAAGSGITYAVMASQPAPVQIVESTVNSGNANSNSNSGENSNGTAPLSVANVENAGNSNAGADANANAAGQAEPAGGKLPDGLNEAVLKSQARDFMGKLFTYNGATVADGSYRSSIIGYADETMWAGSEYLRGRISPEFQEMGRSYPGICAALNDLQIGSVTASGDTIRISMLATVSENADVPPAREWPIVNTYTRDYTLVMSTNLYVQDLVENSNTVVAHNIFNTTL